MADPNSKVVTAQPGHLPGEDGGSLLPTIPASPPLPSLDQVLPITVQLPLWAPRFVSSSPFLKPRYHKVQMRKPPIFNIYDLTPVQNDNYHLSLHCSYLSQQASTDVDEALLDDGSTEGALSVENPQDITETQGTLSEFIRTYSHFPHLDSNCLDSLSPILFEHHSGSKSP